MSEAESAGFNFERRSKRGVCVFLCPTSSTTGNRLEYSVTCAEWTSVIISAISRGLERKTDKKSSILARFCTELRRKRWRENGSSLLSARGAQSAIAPVFGEIIDAHTSLFAGNRFRRPSRPLALLSASFCRQGSLWKGHYRHFSSPLFDLLNPRLIPPCAAVGSSRAAQANESAVCIEVHQQSENVALSLSSLRPLR